MTKVVLFGNKVKKFTELYRSYVIGLVCAEYSFTAVEIDPFKQGYAAGSAMGREVEYLLTKERNTPNYLLTVHRLADSAANGVEFSVERWQPGYGLCRSAFILGFERGLFFYEDDCISYAPRTPGMPVAIRNAYNEIFNP